MQIEEARDAVIAELGRLGVTGVAALNAAIVSARVVTFGSRATINIDFERRDGKIKICLYIHPEAVKKVDQLVAIGALASMIQGVSLEPGSEGLRRQTDGVLFKLNTGVDWESASGQGVATVAQIAMAFKNAISVVAG